MAETSSNTVARKYPDWLRARYRPGVAFDQTAARVRGSAVATVCEEANCPNVGECWSEGHATFMILGDACTRGCRFCSVRKMAHPPAPALDEPQRLAAAIDEMQLQYAVITSVDRDDLPDGGAAHWVACISALRETVPGIGIELLIPDFRHHDAPISALNAVADVIGHNIETVPSLYRRMRAGADYQASLQVLASISAAGGIAKTAIMLGLGEAEEELADTLQDIYATGCRILVLGQYLKPARFSPEPVFVAPERFQAWQEFALELGFHAVVASPLARSSYKAQQLYTQYLANTKAY